MIRRSGGTKRNGTAVGIEYETENGRNGDTETFDDKGNGRKGDRGTRSKNQDVRSKKQENQTPLEINSKTLCSTRMSFRFNFLSGLISNGEINLSRSSIEQRDQTN